MNKIFRFSLLVTVLIFFGCASTNVPLLDNPSALQSGHILSKQKNSVAGDIVCAGKFHPNALRLTQIPFTNLVPSWWKGILSVKNNTDAKNVKISYLNSRGYSLGKPTEMNFIKVKGFDDSYSFPEMTIREPMFSTILKKDLPYTFTEFSLDGEPFLLQMTTMNEPLIKTQYASTTLFELWRYKNQIFTIVGKTDGETYAQFTIDSYQILKQPAVTSPEKLCYAIGVFSVIRNAADRVN